MADFTDTIRLVLDTVTDTATTQVGNMRTKVAEAEGAFGKLKAGAGGAFDAIGVAGPQAALAAGAAVGAFVLSAVGQFQSLALTAGDAATKMGTTVDEASRWMETAADLGVNLDAVTGAAGRLNREAAQGKLAQYGLDAQDANGRLLQTLQYLGGIRDKAEQARAGADLLGKGWQSLSPLIGSAKELNDRLADVSKAKLIDQNELENARRLRDVTDQLSDEWDDFTLTVGQEALPVLADAAQLIGNLVKPIDDVVNAIPGMSDGLLGIVTGPLAHLTEGLTNATDGTLGLGDRAKGLGEAITGAIPGPVGSWAAGLFEVKHKSDDAKDAADGLAGQAALTGDAIEGAGNDAETAAAKIDGLAGSFLSGEAAALRATKQTGDLIGQLQSGQVDVDATKAKFVELGQTMEKSGGTAAALTTLQSLKLYVTPGSELDRYLDSLIANLAQITKGGEGNYTVNVQTKFSGGTAGASGIPFVPPGFPTSPHLVGTPAGAGAGARAASSGSALPVASIGADVGGVSGIMRSGGVVQVTNVTNNWPPSAGPLDVITALNAWASTRGATITTLATGL